MNIEQKAREVAISVCESLDDDPKHPIQLIIEPVLREVQRDGMVVYARHLESSLRKGEMVPSVEAVLEKERDSS